MFGRTFYHGTLRKFVVVFGNMFNGIYVQRFNSSNERVQTLKIPISYGPKEKFLIRLAQDPNLDQDVAISLPRMGFEMVGLNYAANRKLPSSIKHSRVNREDFVPTEFKNLVTPLSTTTLPLLVLPCLAIVFT